jgi:hypothetical protein
MTRLRTGNRRAKRRAWWRQWDLVAPLTAPGGRSLTGVYQHFTTPPLPAWAAKAWLRFVWVDSEGERRAWVVAKRGRPRPPELVLGMQRLAMAAAQAAPAMQVMADGLIKLRETAHAAFDKRA